MRITFTLFFLACFSIGNSQLLTWSPPFIQETSTPVEITMDANFGNKDLLNYTPVTDVYVHMGAITTLSTGPSNWRYAPFAWATTNPAAQAVSVGANKWKFTINGGLRAFFGITDPNEKILKIAILFRNGAGSKAQRNADGGDMYVPVYQPGLNVRIDDPLRQPTYTLTPEPVTKTLGSPLSINAKASVASTLKLYLNGTQVGATATNATTISANTTISNYGQQMIVAEATAGATVKYDTVTFFVSAPSVVAPLPAGVRDGINYEPGDTSVTLVLYAPFKSRVALLGDFNGWKETAIHQMKKTPDSARYWLRVTGLTPGVEYAYQYFIDGSLKVADYMTEKILDPNNDQYIPAANYPNLKAYPAGLTTGIVSVLQTRKPAYTWQINNFAKPDKRNLMIYEMLVRDFVATQNWQTVKDSIAYLKRLGINAIELMPINEFEGNNSWGYNPTFFFAPDKMYGTENALRQFIDECHKQGIAVIMDIVMNHTTGLSPTAQMYWNAAQNKPAANSPWYNQDSPHPLAFGPDFNHEAPATQYLTDRVIEHWITNYKIDGFRWDLSKGFTQKSSSDFGGWGAYDAGRIAIWKRIHNKIQSVNSGTYSILEHFADNSEEIELSNAGMMLWGNLNYNYNEATMGYLPNSNFSNGIYTNRGWSQPNLVTYQESHDEERLMYKNLQYGNVNGTYSVKNLATALKRNEMATAFWAATPAPKMVWQFGELGYDYSINTCEDLTINNNCRVNPKPIRWDYYTNPDRRSLYNVYSKMFKMRGVPNYLPTFVTNNVSYDLGGAFKWLKVTSDSLKIVVIGNFDVSPVTGTVTFQNGGTWYNYLQGGTRTATGGAESFTLQPGEYYVYVNRNVAAQITLPLKLVSFTGNRTSNINLKWNTSNEENVKQFIVERSFDGVVFNAIGSVKATNIREAAYTYNDNDPMAVRSTEKVLYRLRMIDIDGKFEYSNIVAINPVGATTRFAVYPNPAKGSQLFINLAEATQSSLSVRITDAAGRVLSVKTISNTTLNQPIPVDIKGLSNGVYMLKVDTGKKSFVQQFVVQN